MLKALYHLSRPLNALSGFIAVVIGAYVASAPQWLPVVWGALATLLITASSNAWNDVLDIEIDRINQPQRPLPAGLLTPRAAVIFSLSCALASLALAALISWPAFLVALASNLLLYLYSWRLKSTVLLGNIVVALIVGTSVIFGGLAAGNVEPTLWLFATIFCAILGREILKTMADAVGDRQKGVRTVTTVWGKGAARWLTVGLLGTTAVVMLLPYLFGSYSPLYLGVLAIGVYPILLYVMVRAGVNTPGAQLERLSQLLKYDFFVWFIAILVAVR